VLSYARSCPTFLLAVACTILTGCGGLIKPESLKVPEPITCISLPEKISFSSFRGLLKVKWDTSLNAGLYVSEREDDDGTYFRGPQGTFSNWSADYPGMSRTYDGGFWLPKDKTQSPRLYNYFSATSVPVAPELMNTDCSMATFAKDSASQRVNVLLATTSGAVGGAGARALAPGSSMTYGQAAAGGAIGMGIVALMINADVGKIYLQPQLEIRYA